MKIMVVLVAAMPMILMALGSTRPLVITMMLMSMSIMAACLSTSSFFFILNRERDDTRGCFYQFERR